jgi:DNA-binding transcriptional MerR regulator
MFRVGEFSKIAQVSGRLLRYYDQIGLFQPERIDAQTGYRYYGARQLPELNRILALKEMGLTLDQIRRMLEGNISTDEMQGLLVMKKAQLEQTMREQFALIHYIESRIDQIDRAGELKDYAVVLKPGLAQPFLAAREPAATPASLPAIARDIGRWLPEQVDRHALGQFAILFYANPPEADSLDVALGFTVNGPVPDELALPSGRRLTLQELPRAELMATTVHVGLPEVGHRGYAALGMWAEAHNYHFTNPTREVFIRLPRAGEDEVVAEIQVPVEPAEGANL